MGKFYYSVLNVPSSATQREIKIAYRKLVQKHHPDVNQSGNDTLIKQINIAYGTLSNPQKRAFYDQRKQSARRPITPPYSAWGNPVTARRRSPFRNKSQSSSGENLVYSTKIKLLGLAAIVFTILLIWIGMRAMDNYSSKYYFKKGVLAETARDYTSAFNFYRLAVRDLGEKSVEASIRIVELNQQMNSYHAMIDNAVMGLTYNPTSAESARLYFLKGVGYEKMGQYQEAANAYTNSLSYSNIKDTIYSYLAPIYLNQLYNYEEAEKMYSYLLENEPNNLGYYYNRGVSFQQLGSHAQAIKDFTIILKNDPYNGKVLFQLGRSYLVLGQKERACEYLRFAQNQSVHIDPADFAKACL